MIKFLILIGILYLIFKPKGQTFLNSVKEAPNSNSVKIKFAYHTGRQNWIIYTGWFENEYIGYPGEHLSQLFRRYLKDIHNRDVSLDTAKELIEEKLSTGNLGSEAHARWIHETR